MIKNIFKIVYQQLYQQFSRPPADDFGRGKPLAVGRTVRGFCRAEEWKDESRCPARRGYLFIEA